MIKNNYPTIRPSLDLNFAGSKTVDPRITFTRASTATYYDGKTFAKAEENLLTYSQQFDNAAWTKTNATVIANTEVAPDGTTTADTLTATAANAVVSQAITATALPHVFSVYLKRKTGTGAVEIQSASGTWTAAAVTTTWTQFNVTTTPTAGSGASGIRLTTSGDEVFVWGAQLEQRSQVTAYTPTTTQPITRYQPVLLTAPANAPRIDHDPVTGECKGLLIEEQRTNLLLRSQEFQGSAGTTWANNMYSNWVNAPFSANTSVAPDGTISADVISFNNTFANKMQLVTGIAASTSYTFTIFAKAAKASNDYSLGIFIRVATGNSGTLVNSLFSVLKISERLSATAWTRFEVTFTTPDSGVNEVSIGLSGAGGDAAPAADVAVWGAQLEAGAFPTSYIKTEASQVARAADSTSMTGTNFSSWYRQDAGAIIADYISGASTLSQAIASIDNGTIANRIGLFHDGGNTSLVTPGFVITVSGAAQGVTAHGSASLNSAHKMAASFSTSESAAVFDGGTSQSISNIGLPLVDRLVIGNSGVGGQSLNGHIKRIAYYPTHLPNAQLRALNA